MAAAVAQAPQGIVFAQKANAGTAIPLAPGGPEGSGPVLQAPLYLKSVLLQIVLQHCRGVILLSVILRVVVDLVGHGKQGLLLLLDQFIQLLFHLRLPHIFLPQREFVVT